MDNNDDHIKQSTKAHHSSLSLQEEDEDGREESDSKSSLMNILNDLSTIKLQQQQQKFQQMTTMKATTGGTNITTGISNDACAIGTQIFSTISSSSLASMSSTLSQNFTNTTNAITSTATSTKKAKTLSFLHNEDIFDESLTSPTMITHHNPNLFRSVSFQDRRMQNQHASMKRTDSGSLMTTSAGNITRKISILSPKHSFNEMNERLKTQQIKFQLQMQQQIQQQMQNMASSFSNSSDGSL